MVVFGSASWIKDSELTGEGEADRVALFRSCVNWLQGEEQDVGKGDEKERGRTHEIYVPNVSTDSQWWLYQLLLLGLPAYVLMAAVVVIGAGIWVVRRR